MSTAGTESAKILLLFSGKRDDFSASVVSRISGVGPCLYFLFPCTISRSAVEFVQNVFRFIFILFFGCSGYRLLPAGFSLLSVSMLLVAVALSCCGAPAPRLPDFSSCSTRAHWPVAA